MDLHKYFINYQPIIFYKFNQIIIYSMLFWLNLLKLYGTKYFEFIYSMICLVNLIKPILGNGVADTGSIPRSRLAFFPGKILLITAIKNQTFLLILVKSVEMNQFKHHPQKLNLCPCVYLWKSLFTSISKRLLLISNNVTEYN